MPTISAEQIQELERCVERLERVVEELDTRQPDTIHSLRLSSLKIRKLYGTCRRVSGRSGTNTPRFGNLQLVTLND